MSIFTNEKETDTCAQFERNTPLRENIYTRINNNQWKIIAFHVGELEIKCNSKTQTRVIKMREFCVSLVGDCVGIFS